MINEAKISSGWKDVELSELGIRQAKELRSKMLSRAEAEKLIEDTEPRRSKEIKIDLVCCSDLKRAIDTVKIAFGNKYPIIIDKRLRECDYGDFTGKPSEIVDSIRKEKIKESFPNGESYEQAVARIQDFYLELKKKYPDKNILIVGHRATQYGLDTLIAGKTIEECLNESLSFKWQAYWEYDF